MSERDGQRSRMVIACRPGLAGALKGVIDGRTELMVFGVAGAVTDVAGVIQAADPDVLVVESGPDDTDGLTFAAVVGQRRPGTRIFVLNEVLTGAPVADPEAPGGLTSREIQVLRLLSEGLDLKSISRVLAISLHTTRGHVKNILTKLGAHSQLAAVVTASRLGYLTPSPAAP